jgi:hypothetical protein
MSSVTIAIDPGQGGGIAVNRNGNITAMKMPKTNELIQDFMRMFWEPDLIAYIEKLSAASVSFGNMKSSKTIWSQASNYSALMCALYNANIPVEEVLPRTWMDKLPATTDRPKDYAKRKRWLKEQAQILYPDIKVTLWNADALFILYTMTMEA